MGQRINQPAYSGGEISREARARVDQEKRQLGLLFCRNMRVKKGGGVESRPGTHYVRNATFGNLKGKLFSFERSADIGLLLEFNEDTLGQSHMSILDGDADVAFHPLLGQPMDSVAGGAGGDVGWIQSTADPNSWYEDGTHSAERNYADQILFQLVDRESYIVAAPPEEISVTVNATLSEGTLGALNAIEYAFGDIDSIGSDRYYVRSISGHPTGGSAFPVLMASFRLDIPWLAADFFKLNLAQSADVLIFTNDGYPVGVISRFANGYWTYKDAPFDPEKDPPENFRLSVTTGGGTAFNYQYALTSIQPDGSESKVDEAFVGMAALPSPGDFLVSLVWDLELFPVVGAGSGNNLTFQTSDYVWINSAVYFGSGASDIYFLAKKGTGTNEVSDPAQDPRLFTDREREGPVALYQNDADWIGLVPMLRAAVPVPLRVISAWRFGTQNDFESGSSATPLGWETIWMYIASTSRTSGDQDPNTLSSFTLQLETVIGYNIYRREGTRSTAGELSGTLWGAWGLFISQVAYGGVLIGGADSAFVTDVKGNIRDTGAIVKDETRFPPKELKVFKESGDFPAAVGFIDQRMALGGTINDQNRSWYSESGDFFKFVRGDVNVADGAIERALTTANEIKHFADAGSLIVFTSGGEWRVFSADGGGITPLTIDAKRAGRNGISDLRPLSVENLIIYAQRLGAGIYGIQFSEERGGYVSYDLSAFSEDLLSSPIVSWDYEGKPNQLIHGVRADGRMIDVTFDQSQRVNAWALEYMMDDDIIEDVSVVRQGDAEFVYLNVLRYLGANLDTPTRMIERFDLRRFDNYPQQANVDSSLSYAAPELPVTGFFSVFGVVAPVIDTLLNGGNLQIGDWIQLSGIVSDGTNEGDMTADFLNGKRAVIANDSTAPTYTLMDASGNFILWEDNNLTALSSTGVVRKMVSQISGIEHLNYKALTVVADGVALAGTYSTTDGTLAPSNMLALDVIVGIAFEAFMEPLDFSGGPGAETLVGVAKAIDTIHVEVLDTYGFEIEIEGYNEQPLISFPVAPRQDPAEQPIIMDGIFKVEVGQEWTEGGRYRIKALAGQPLTVLATTPRYTMGAEDIEQD